MADSFTDALRTASRKISEARETLGDARRLIGGGKGSDVTTLRREVGLLEDVLVDIRLQIEGLEILGDEVLPERRHQAAGGAQAGHGERS